MSFFFLRQEQKSSLFRYNYKDKTLIIDQRKRSFENRITFIFN